MKSRLVLLVVGAFALWQNTSGLQAQTNPGDGLNAPSLTWVTGGNNAMGWTYEPHDGFYGDNTFDGMDSAKSAWDDNGESWIQTEVTGPGTISFWWKAYSEPGGDWLEFWIDENRQDAICGDTDWYSAAYPSGWEYRSFAVPSGRHTLKWRYVKDDSLTGGTSDYSRDAGLVGNYGLLLVKTAGADTVAFGATVTFTYTVKNLGSGAVVGTFPFTSDTDPITSIRSTGDTGSR